MFIQALVIVIKYEKQHFLFISARQENLLNFFQTKQKVLRLKDLKKTSISIWRSEIWVIFTWTTLTTKKRENGREARTRSIDPRVMNCANNPGASSHCPDPLWNNMINQMLLMEDDYQWEFLVFKLRVERISAVAGHLYCSVSGINDGENCNQWREKRSNFIVKILIYCKELLKNIYKSDLLITVELWRKKCILNSAAQHCSAHFDLWQLHWQLHTTLQHQRTCSQLWKCQDALREVIIVGKDSWHNF